MKTTQFHTLCVAASRGDLTTISTLHDQGFSLAAEGEDSKRTPLHWAALKGQVAAGKYIANRILKESIDHKDKDGNTPLNLCASMGGKIAIRLPMIECLLDLGANPLISNLKTQTPFMSAILIRNSEQAQNNPEIAKQVEQIIQKMRNFVGKLAVQNNQYYVINGEGAVRFIPRPGPLSVSDTPVYKFNTFPKVVGTAPKPGGEGISHHVIGASSSDRSPTP